MSRSEASMNQQHFDEVFPARAFNRLLCCGWSKEKSAKAFIVLEVETGLDCGRGDVRVFGGIQCCRNVSWLSLPRNYKKKMPTLPWRCSRAQSWRRERERAAAPPLFKCKYLTEPVDRYAINMDPLKGGQALECCLRGQKGHRVKSEKGNVDPLDQYWLNFVISSSPSSPPQTNTFSCGMSLFDCQPLRATVTSAARADKNRRGGTCWAFCAPPNWNPPQCVKFTVATAYTEESRTATTLKCGLKWICFFFFPSLWVFLS